MIYPLLLYQFHVGSFFGNHPILQGYDKICITDGRQAMCNHDGSPIPPSLKTRPSDIKLRYVQRGLQKQISVLTQKYYVSCDKTYITAGMSIYIYIYISLCKKGVDRKYKVDAHFQGRLERLLLIHCLEPKWLRPVWELLGPGPGLWRWQSAASDLHSAEYHVLQPMCRNPGMRMTNIDRYNGKSRSKGTTSKKCFS